MHIVTYHVLCAIRAALAESNGWHREATRLRALGNLRLIVMSDDELQDLARYLSNPPIRTVESVQDELLARIDELRGTAGDWIPELFRDPADSLPRN